MTTIAETKARSSRLAIWKALLLCVPVVLLTGVILMGILRIGDPLISVPAVLVWVAFIVLFCLMMVTGETHRYRSPLFILTAVMMPFSFIPNMIEARGSMVLTEADAISGDASFCPLAIPMIVLPAAITRTVIFPGAILGGYGVAAMLVMMIGVTLALGRGWCSWGCFYGGWDEGFSRILKKPVIRRIDRRWTYLPFGVLLAVVLSSALALSPTYCEWLCPFKVVTEFGEVNSALAVVQTVIFVSLFIALVVVLPLLTKRRTQCGLFCPFGAFLSFFNWINVFEVRIDRAKCVECQRCINTCPTFSLDETSLESGKSLITCTKCAKCVDTCPKDAISYHIKGTPLGIRANTARVLLLYPAYLLMFTIGGGMIIQGVWRILRWVTTGSMI
jgi:polyferredoxin